MNHTEFSKQNLSSETKLYYSLVPLRHWGRKLENNTWWRYQMETFSALLAICAGNSPVNSPHKGQWRGALVFSLICIWINGWVNNGEAGDLRRYRTHYDVIVTMCLELSWWPAASHQSCFIKIMMTSWNGTLFHVTVPFVRGIHRFPVDSPHKASVTRSFDVSFDVRLNIRLNKHGNRRWFETTWPSSWHLIRMQCSIIVYIEI